LLWLFLKIGSCFFAQAGLDNNPLIFCLPTMAGMTYSYHHTQLLIEMEPSKFFAKAGLEP
jgi:hypothetical protein